ARPRSFWNGRAFLRCRLTVASPHGFRPCWRQADSSGARACCSSADRASGHAMGFVTLPCREREAWAPQELSGRCDCSPPRGHRDTAKRAVRLGGDEMALDVEGVVDGGVCGKKFLG